MLFFIFTFRDAVKNEEQYDELMNILLDQFVLPATMYSDVNPTEADSINSCPTCQKTYKSVKGLKKHMKEKIHFASKISFTENTIPKNFVFNYSTKALGLCFLAKNFLDAQKRGDGERICRLYKYFMLLFKLVGKHKYGYQSLNLLGQINYFLPPAMAHEITWNRCVNNKGFPDSNVELDRELEHRNKYVKGDIKAFNGKVTPQSIRRCSSSYNQMENIVSNFDRVTEFNTPSGKHTNPDWKKDVQDLKKLLVEENLFKFQKRSLL